MHPFGFNPHLLPSEEQQTTRAALHKEHAPDRNSSYARVEELEAEIRRLHSLIQQDLGIISLDPSRTKKRKLDHEPSERNMASMITPFRLVSSVFPPQPISLVPAHFNGIPHQRPLEDTPAEEQLRCERAQQVAVDADWVFMQARVQNNLSAGLSVQTLSPVQSSINPSQLPRLIVTERTLSKKRLASAEETATKGIRCCPLIPVHDSPSSSTLPKKRKRKRVTSPQNHSLPRFFRPMQQWGGKSAGYAMGWNGSHRTTWAGSRGYVRDTMRKGVTLSRLEQIG